jgi:hypothetical protein
MNTANTEYNLIQTGNLFILKVNGVEGEERLWLDLSELKGLKEYLNSEEVTKQLEG